VNATRPARWLLVAIVALMMGAGVWAPCPYDKQFREQIAAQPSRAHLLGTDAVGRDRFSRLLYGGRISLLLAPAAALLSVGIALAIALGAALAGRWRETAAMAFIDLFLSLPWLFLLLAVRAVLPLNATPALSIAVTFALLGLLGWPGPARVLIAAARGQLQSPYVLRARASGCGPWRLAVIEMAPNLAPLAWAQFWTTAPAYLLAEVNMTLLGLGVAEPLPSWGSLLRELQNLSSIPRQPWILVPLAVLMITLGCSQLAWRSVRAPDPGCTFGLTCCDRPVGWRTPFLPAK
jgi:ABC-type dipeptide/oligopeptide/nickel transport system permease subunit